MAALVLSLILSSCGPSDFEKEKLAFEKKKYDDEQKAKAEVEQREAQDKEEQKNRWMNCRVRAEEEYNSDFKTWGSPVPGKPGLRNGPANQLEQMKNRLQRENEQCDRNFPKGVSW